MAELSDDLKLEVVTRLARFDTPTEIMKDFRTRGIEVAPNQVGSYDPTRTYYEAGDKWREIFDAARKGYLEDVAAVPAANQGYRLQVLQKGIEAATAAKNWNLASRLIEQASKEVGGAYTNQREVSINDSRKQSARDATPEDRKQMFAELVRQAIEKMPTPPGADPAHTTTQ